MTFRLKMKTDQILLGVAVCLSAAMVCGCGDSQPAPVETADPAQSAAPEAAAGKTLEEALPDSEPEIPDESAESPDGDQAASGGSRFKPLTMNAVAGSSEADADASAAGAALDTERRIQLIMKQLKPLQVILGQWRGTTRREYEGFKAVDNHEWIWDLQTDPSSPALALKSDKSPYLQQARLTWNPSDSQFLLTATDAEGVTREYSGQYTDPVHEVVGSDDKLHRVFRLELNQVNSGDSEEWQIAFAQQENNRYLLEVAKRRGSADFRRFDTVSTQREGTSFAISDTEYGDRTCIISQGLGTISVSYKGKSYWVCCSGCKAAFDENPEKWIARAAANASE